MRRRTRRRRAPALGMQGAAAGGALPRGAAKAMVAHGDARALELARGELGEPDATAAERHAEHLVEVAVVHESLPVDGNQRAAHHALEVLVAVGGVQQRHVLVEGSLRHQRRAEALDRHVGERVEAVEAHTVALAELALVVRLELVLGRRQRGTLRVVDQVQREPVAVAEPVQLAQRGDAALVDPRPALAIDQLERVARQRGDDLDPLARQELGQITLPGLLQDGEVAAVDDLLAQPPRARHETAELRMQLRGAARDVERRDARQEGDHVLDHLRRHHLGARRAGVDVAVHATLVAAVADVDLQRLQPLAAQGREAVLPQQRERRMHQSRCGGGAPPACCSSSRPRRRALVARRRCDSISTSSIRILAPRRGCSTMIRARLSRAGTARYTSMKCASVLTSESEKCSSSVHFGMSAWIWPANLAASPRYSRCASCCRRCAMGSADYAKAERLRLTASARAARTFVESSQPRQGSVMLCPKTSGLPPSSSWRPSTRCDSTITPTMRRSPRASCAAMSRATSIWRLYCFAALACEQSIIRRSGRPARASSAQAACTLAAS